MFSRKCYGSNTFCGKIFKNTAKTRICVLNIIYWILRIFLNCQVEVKIKVAVGLTCVKEKSCGVKWHLVQKGYKGYSFTATLRSLNSLSVLNKTHHLHKNY